MALSPDDRRVALVSGGSRGIGAAVVRRLAADGWDIGLGHHRDAQAARAVEKAVSELGVRVAATDLDVTDAAQVTAWFRETEDELGPAGALVSCAGLTRDQPLTRLAEADWRTVIDTGLVGVFHLCRAAMSAMMERRSGRIVTVSSVCAAYDHSAPGHDATTRPGMPSIVKVLAAQAARFGISVNAVTPGPLTHDLTAILPDTNRATLTETVTLRRFGDTTAVADLTAFLLSEAAADITGSVLEVRSVFSLLPRHGYPPRPAAAEDVPAVQAVVADAYARYLTRMDRPPAPLASDYAAAAQAGQLWVTVRPGPRPRP